MEFEDIIFMDDEYGNIEAMEAQGIASQYVPRNGTTFDATQELVQRWQDLRQQR